MGSPMLKKVPSNNSRLPVASLDISPNSPLSPGGKPLNRALHSPGVKKLLDDAAQVKELAFERAPTMGAGGRDSVLDLENVLDRYDTESSMLFKTHRLNVRGLANYLCIFWEGKNESEVRNLFKLLFVKVCYWPSSFLKCARSCARGGRGALLQLTDPAQGIHPLTNSSVGRALELRVVTRLTTRCCYSGGSVEAAAIRDNLEDGVVRAAWRGRPHPHHRARQRGAPIPHAIGPHSGNIPRSLTRLARAVGIYPVPSRDWPTRWEYYPVPSRDWSAWWEYNYTCYNITYNYNYTHVRSRSV
eukprot:4462609-Pyramimonas_sp.AAC.1